MAWMCARYAFQVLVATSLVVMLSAWPLAAQEGDGEASSEEPRFDVFWGGGVSFAEDLGIPFTLDAGVTAWLWDWWGGTWGGGAWFTGMPAVNQGSRSCASCAGWRRTSGIWTSAATSTRRALSTRPAGSSAGGGKRMRRRRADDLFDRIATFGALWRRGPGPAAFLANLETEVLALERELRAGTWRPGGYVSFEVRDPKRRMISAAPFRDRVVHHAVHAVIAPLFERRFIGHTYANRAGKGTHRAVARYEWLRDRHRHVLRGDIYRYFPGPSTTRC